METEQRMFNIVAKFRVIGNVPNMISEDHIRGKIEAQIKDINFALDGEYYGDYDEEWEMYVPSYPHVEVEKFSIEYVQRPSCEHCGIGYEDFGVQISDGDSLWCLGCWLTEHAMTEEEIKEITSEEKKLKKEYLKKKLKELEE